MTEVLLVRSLSPWSVIASVEAGQLEVVGWGRRRLREAGGPPPLCQFTIDASLLLYLTPVIQQAGSPPEILQALFDLSPAEARVAAMIAEGHLVKLIAENLSVQPNTVRAQLKAVFAKTGTGRQGELVSLLRSPP